jgi:hypothetical protein
MWNEMARDMIGSKIGIDQRRNPRSFTHLETGGAGCAMILDENDIIHSMRGEIKLPPVYVEEMMTQKNKFKFRAFMRIQTIMSTVRKVN